MSKTVWIDVKFDFDECISREIRHARTGRLLRTEYLYTGKANTCSTSMPAQEKENVLKYFTEHEDTKQFHNRNPRNFTFKN